MRRVSFLIISVFALAAVLSAAVPVVPLPATVRNASGWFRVGSATPVSAPAGTLEIAQRFAGEVRDRYSVALRVGDSPAAKGITLVLDESLPEEGYRLKIGPSGIRAEGRPAGLFYATQTLLQLMDAAPGLRLAAVEIEDQPRFPYRGLHLDTCRHFFEVQFIKRYLDWMARYKLNRFHWHLTDDQGWRLEIKKYPRLTSVGSVRKETVVGHADTSSTYDGKPYGGFYTQEQVRDVVDYARSRFITVIPEIEMPGHATAALAAYPELACTAGPFEVATTWGVFKDIFCPSEPTFTFLENVLAEVMELFPSPYIHVGGDEVPKDRWKESPAAQAVMQREGLKSEDQLQSYFIGRMDRFLTSRGRRMIGWDEILQGGLSPNATVMSWRGEKGGIEAAKQHHDVIMTPEEYLYLDHYQSRNRAAEPLAIGGYVPLEKVYGYNPLPASLSSGEKARILGAQANVWTEYLKAPRDVEYMLFPRVLALAEVVWTPRESRAWTGFAQRVPGQLARLKKEGVNYRPLKAAAPPPIRAAVR